MSGHGRILALVFLFSAFLSLAVYLPSVQAASLPVQTSQITPSASSGSYFDHVVVIMMENEGIYDICRSSPPPCNNSNAPYMSSLANTYGIGSQYLSLINTSWPNYYGILGASIFGCPSSCYPAPGSVTATNLVDRFEAAGLSWKGYMEDQNVAAGCDTGTHDPYVPIHNGFILFQDITTNSARCGKLVLANPSSCASTDCTLVNDLNSVSAPNFMWLTPNGCNDMYGLSSCTNGCTAAESLACINAGDKYLSSLVPNILLSSTFKNTRAALFVTFDEGNGYCPLNGGSEDCMYAVWAGPTAKTTFSSSKLYNDYSLTKTIETNWNLATLTSNDANAVPMTEFFQQSSPQSDFTISASPSSIQFVSGSSTSFTVTVSPTNGFTGTVTLATSSSPSTGLTVNCNPTTVSGGSGTSNCTVASSTTGNYVITITGTSGSLSHSATVNVSVQPAISPDFTISANPTSRSIVAGSSTTSTITIASTSGFSGTVSLAATSSPTGPTVSVNPSSLTITSGGSGTSTLTVSTQSTTTPGSYTVTITGSSGSLSHSTTVSVTVSSASTSDFSISANPSSVSIQRSSSTTGLITLTSLNSFSGTIQLTMSTSSSLHTSLSVSSITLTPGSSGTANLSIRVPKRIPLGTYTITVTASTGSISHSTTITVQVV